LGGPQAVRNKRKNKRKNGALTKKHGFCCAHCAAETFFTACFLLFFEILNLFPMFQSAQNLMVKRIFLFE
jgi:hypothetical protein